MAHDNLLRWREGGSVGPRPCEWCGCPILGPNYNFIHVHCTNCNRNCYDDEGTFYTRLGYDGDVGDIRPPLGYNIVIPRTFEDIMSILRSQRNALEQVQNALVTLQTSMANITTTLMAQRDSYKDPLTNAQISYITEADTLIKYARLALHEAVKAFPDDTTVQALKRRVNEQLDKM